MRGITYIVWDRYNENHLNESRLSNQTYEDEVIVIKDDKTPGLGKKKWMFDHSSFETTLYLDTDTIIKSQKLNYGFEMAEKYGIACCIAPASSAYHAQPNKWKEMIHPDLPQLNTGVIFFDRTNPVVKKVFDRWMELINLYPNAAGLNDQIAFSIAVYEHLNPFILPRTWNYRAKIRYEAKVIHGELKILHAK